MRDIVSLAKRRGFVFPSSEIYGGLNGFWDYGPLGNELKRNVKAAWWDDMVARHNRLVAPPGAPAPFDMAGLDSAVILHPQVWRVSGHYDLFHDVMVDCRETKRRFRFDHMRGRAVSHRGEAVVVAVIAEPDEEQALATEQALSHFKLRRAYADQLEWRGGFVPLSSLPDTARVLAPGASVPGTLTAPRDFNLMLETTLGAAASEDGRAFLRPETAQGIFLNFKNVLDTTRAKLPLGIAQIGKSFRNEITPRNFTFRSREFEQMECEFFCAPETSPAWYRYWRDRRYAWYRDLGLSEARLRAREHDADELSHYSTGTCDIEYAFPFLPEGEYGELEGVAHRGDFDLRSHMHGKLDPATTPLAVERDPATGAVRHAGSGKNLAYRDDASGQTFLPHVIEPAAGADRATLAFLCEAYEVDHASDDQGRPQERTVLRLDPRLAPFKVAVLPLVKKDGMPEIARELYGALRREMACDYDEKDAVGRRYRRHDEIGTPFCLTVDSQTLSDGTVTIRDRDTLAQARIRIDDAAAEIRSRLGPGRAAPAGG